MVFHCRKTSVWAAGSRPTTERSRSWASPMTCMSAYSMPLCTILTKCPAPSVSIQAQQGVPSSALAAMVSSRGPTDS